jgi:hypothetical protein
LVFSILISSEDGYLLKIEYFSTKEFDSISLIRSILLIEKILFKLKFFIFFSKVNLSLISNPTILILLIFCNFKLLKLILFIEPTN